MILVLFTALLSPLFGILSFARRRKNVSRILLIQTAKIGDLVCTTPLIASIKQQCPQSELHMLVNPVAQPVIRHNPHVDRIISHSSADMKGFAGKMQLLNLMVNGHYDAVVICNTNTALVIASVWAAIPRRIGIVSEFSGTTYRIAAGMLTTCIRHRQGRMVMETYAEMLRPLGVTADIGAKEVFASPAAAEKAGRFLVSAGIRQEDTLIGIAVSAGNRMKEIDSATLSGVIDVLCETAGRHFLLIGAEQDKDAARRIVDSSRNAERILDSTGLFDLDELPPLLSRCRLFIGADTGIVYIADAVHVPLVLIPGPADMDDQRPTGAQCVFLKSSLDCVPCSHAFRAPYSCQRKDRACIISVTPEAIADAAETLLSDAHAG